MAILSSDNVKTERLDIKSSDPIRRLALVNGHSPGELGCDRSDIQTTGQHNLTVHRQLSGPTSRRAGYRKTSVCVR